MTRAERQGLFEDMQAFGIKRFRDGGVEVETLPPAPFKKPGALADEPLGMPSREELEALKNRINAAPHVGPPKE